MLCCYTVHSNHYPHSGTMPTGQQKTPVYQQFSIIIESLKSRLSSQPHLQRSQVTLISPVCERLTLEFCTIIGHLYPTLLNVQFVIHVDVKSRLCDSLAALAFCLYAFK